MLIAAEACSTSRLIIRQSQVKSAYLVTLIGRAKEIIRSQLDNISRRARCYMDGGPVEGRKRRRKEKEKENGEGEQIYI